MAFAVRHDPVPCVAETGCDPGARRAQSLADVAVWALCAEATLTPKPALVDGRGSGAHRDLTLALLLRSACSLRPAFVAMAETARQRHPDPALRMALAAIGRDGERAMMAATGGSNAHRGAIWVLGLLTAAAAMDPAVMDPSAIAARAAAVARHPDRFIPAPPSHGQAAAARFGVTGARGEAQAGFPHVVAVGLPALRHSRAAGATETQARLDALMAIMARLDDTCLLHRGGMAALQAGQRGAVAVLAAGGAATAAGRAALEALHQALMALNASPGGAADMLAAALFLDRIVPLAGAPDRSQTEDFSWKY
ncbi:MAG: triphosphoribosyl-dephospho-CoA synthase [Azospirillaceae bacterium]|nr:triphosphoribosyl-dephospho-CoA synthase [Azospirillaceae bacterium]